METPEVNSVYMSPQPETSPPVDGDGGGTRLFISNNYTMSGEQTSETGKEIDIKTERVANFKVMRGTSTTVWGYLSKLKDFLPNGPNVVNSRDGKVKIHNHRFNQPPQAYYVYRGGNGELLDINVTTNKTKKHVDIATTSNIDPKTKSVNTTVTQVHTNTEAPRKSWQGEWVNGKMVGYKPKASLTLGKLKGVMSEKHPGDYRREMATNARSNKIKNAKSEKEARAEAAKNYQVTQEDCDKYFEAKKSEFNKLLEEAKRTGNPEPILKSNSMSGMIVKRKISIKTKINPETYSDNYMNKQQIRDLVRDGVDGASNISTYQWNNGFSHLKNKAGVIILPHKKNGYQYKPGDMVEVVMDKEVEVEIDGARVFASASPHQVSSTVAENDLKKSSQEQITGQLKVLGRPSLESSRVIYISGLSKQDSGQWYIKKVKHSFSSAGYTCDIECIRKGITAGVSTVTSKVNTREIYSNYKKVAQNALKNKTYNDDSEFKQEFKQYIKEHPDETDGSLFGVVGSTNGKPSIAIIPASRDGVNLSNTREIKKRR